MVKAMLFGYGKPPSLENRSQLADQVLTSIREDAAMQPYLQIPCRSREAKQLSTAVCETLRPMTRKERSPVIDLEVTSSRRKCPRRYHKCWH